MDEINGKWLRERLTGKRGEKAELSRVTGISPEKISKILADQRKVQADEAPRIYRFFYPAPEATDAEIIEARAIWYSIPLPIRELLLDAVRGHVVDEDRARLLLPSKDE